MLNEGTGVTGEVAVTFPIVLFGNVPTLSKMYSMTMEGCPKVLDSSSWSSGTPRHTPHCSDLSNSDLCKCSKIIQNIFRGEMSKSTRLKQLEQWYPPRHHPHCCDLSNSTLWKCSKIIQNVFNGEISKSTPALEQWHPPYCSDLSNSALCKSSKITPNVLRGEMSKSTPALEQWHPPQCCDLSNSSLCKCSKSFQNVFNGEMSKSTPALEQWHTPHIALTFLILLCQSTPCVQQGHVKGLATSFPSLASRLAYYEIKSKNSDIGNFFETETSHPVCNREALKSLATFFPLPEMLAIVQNLFVQRCLRQCSLTKLYCQKNVCDDFYDKKPLSKFLSMRVLVTSCSF